MEKGEQTSKPGSLFNFGEHLERVVDGLVGLLALSRLELKDVAVHAPLLVG